MSKSQDPQLKLDDYLPYRLSVASNRVSRLIARAYEDRFGLSIPEWRLICVLAEDGPSTQQAVVARTAMDKVMVSRAAQGLTKRHLVARSPNESDGRSHRLELTEAGLGLYGDISPLALHYEKTLLEGLAPDAVVRFKAELLRLEQIAERIESNN